MRSQTKLIAHVLEKNDWKQTDLAKEIGVSRAQITKWKNGTDHLPHEREKELVELGGLDPNVNTDWSLFAPKESDREAWVALVHEAMQLCEGGCNAIVDSLNDAPDLYTSFVLFTLRDKIGLTLPLPPEDPEKFLETGDNPFAAVLIEFLDNYNGLVHWADVYLEGDQFDDELYDEKGNIAIDEALSMAAYWIDDKLYVAAGVAEEKLSSIKHEIKIGALRSVEKLCRKMLSRGIPFEIDYFDFVNKHPYELDDMILFHKGLGIPNSVEAILPYEQRRMIKLLEDNQKILNEIRDALVGQKSSS